MTPNSKDLSELKAEDDLDGKIEVIVDKLYFVEVPELKKQRHTPNLKKKPYRGMAALKKLPEEQSKRVSKSQEIKPETCEERRKRDFSKTAPNQLLNELEFLFFSFRASIAVYNTLIQLNNAHLSSQCVKKSRKTLRSARIVISKVPVPEFPESRPLPGELIHSNPSPSPAPSPLRVEFLT